MDEQELKIMHAHWAHIFESAPHKDGLDRETFSQAVARSILPNWEPKLLGQLFDFVNKSKSGVVSLNEWANMIETLGSKRGKLRLLYGVCGDKGDPGRIACTLSMLSKCWRGRELTLAEIEAIEKAQSFYTPEKFVRLLKKQFSDLLVALDNVKFKPQV
jgi:hypothetical protein